MFLIVILLAVYIMSKNTSIPIFVYVLVIVNKKISVFPISSMFQLKKLISNLVICTKYPLYAQKNISLPRYSSMFQLKKLHPNLVICTGFGPVNATLRGWCVKPLHQQTNFVEPSSFYHIFVVHAI